MKRRREEQIMLDAFQNVNVPVTADIKKAVVDGLRQIRRERYENRKAQKLKRNNRCLHVSQICETEDSQASAGPSA